MPTIFINNFRGFKDTFISLKEVNFLVGENSTGKTSILKLIKVLSEGKFWFTLEFDTDEVELGYFSEICSKNSNDKYFDIGILGDEDKDDEAVMNAVKMRFKDDDGLPVIEQMRIINKNYDIHVTIKNKEVRFRYSDLKDYFENETDKTDKDKLFKDWILNNRLTSAKYKRVPRDKEIPISILLFNLERLIDSEEKDKKSEGSEKPRFGIRVPRFLRDITWIAPIREKPKRTYDNYKVKFTPEGSHAPFLLKKLMTGKAQTTSAKEFRNALKDFGKESGLFDEIKVKPLGREKTSPFEIQIQLNGTPFKISNVGYGVSQVIPLITEMLARRGKNWFAIQQPEIHLHPKGQAAFGELIYFVQAKEDKRFIVETHSDFLIDRFRLSVHRNKSEESASKYQVLFFERTEYGNKITPISILPSGRYEDDQPKSFKEFFIKEQLELIKI